MSNNHKTKSDTPIKKTNVNTANKVITLEDIWSILTNIEGKVKENETNLNDINFKLKI